jgi:hypothetical protein
VHTTNTKDDDITNKQQRNDYMTSTTEIVTGTKRIQYQGLNAYLPVLIVKLIHPENGKTIKTVHISTGDPLVFKKDAIKYAHIWRNESYDAGYITHN